MGKKHIKQALNIDPDCAKYQKFWKNINKGEKLKAEANDAFLRNDIVEALAHYDECLRLDPLNNGYNKIIWYNRACALAKTTSP